MPKIKYRKIYDDDGNEMLEGSKVLVNSQHERILHFDTYGEIAIEDFHWDDVETIEQMPDDRYDGLE